MNRNWKSRRCSGRLMFVKRSAGSDTASSWLFISFTSSQIPIVIATLPPLSKRVSGRAVIRTQMRALSGDSSVLPSARTVFPMTWRRKFSPLTVPPLRRRNGQASSQSGNTSSHLSTLWLRSDSSQKARLLVSRRTKSTKRRRKK